MNVYQVYFSPTGGTKKVLDIVSNAWECEKQEIDLSKKDVMNTSIAMNEEDLCIVAVPSFGGRVPQVVKERLCAIHGNGCKCILIVVYGNRAYEDTLLELKHLMKERGFQCVAGISAVARHSIMHQFATNRPDDADREELLSFAHQIQSHVKMNTWKEVEVVGNVAYRAYHTLPMVPSTSTKCCACGICVANCPVQAIDKANPRETNSAVCISCMRCVEICPVHARSVNEQMLKAATAKLEKACSGRKKNELFLTIRS